MNKKDLVNQVILGSREYGISSVLFRHAIGEILGLNVTDMECLATIYFKGIAKPSELSQYTGISSGSTTAMLDRLEKAGLIERRPNPEDRRGTLIVPTKNQTTKKVSVLFESLRKAQDAFISSYSEKELKFLADYFKKSVSLLEEERKKLM